MTFKGKYINGHIELIDEVKAENNSEVEIRFLNEEKVKPMKITPEDEEERLRKAAERLAPLYETDEELQAFKKIEGEAFYD